MALYALTQSAVWALVRHLSQELSTETIFLFRNIVGILTVLPLFFQQGMGILHTRYFRSHLIRSIAAFIGGFSIFISIALLPLSSAVSISFSAPVFASIFAIWLFNEQLGKLRLLSLILGFIGVVVTLRPSFDVPILGLAAAYLGTIMTAVAFIMVKSLSGKENHTTTIAYPFVLLLPISAIVAIFNWTTPTYEQLPALLLMGLGVSLSQYFLVKAMALSEASKVLPIDFLRLLFATFFGVIFFNDQVDTFVIVGGCIIFCSALLLSGKKEARDGVST